MLPHIRKTTLPVRASPTDRAPARSRLLAIVRAGPVLSIVAGGIAVMAMLYSPPAAAQGGPMMPGDAVVTGFSGFKPVDTAVPSPDPLARFFIDPDGNAMQVLRLQPNGPPQGQLVPSLPVLQAKAGQIGQVFAITLAPPLAGAPAETPVVPDIYLGATSAFGIQIVRPGPAGQLERIRTGDPAAQWMLGQFGTTLDGGPGSIYRVDGRSGAASLFATIDNSGPGLGDVVYDPTTRQFFASDLDTGLIHRIGADGTKIDSFDHGLAGRPARGGAPLPDDGSRMTITNPAFDSEDTATWGFTPRGRMVYGMALFAGRLYYAVTEGAEIWSIGLRLDGDFANDARFETTVPNVPAGALVTDLAFDGEGRLYVALRGAPRGSYDYAVFAEKTGGTDVRRFRREVPDDPATPGYWAAMADEYAIGLPEPFRNASGGVSLGHGHEPSGAVGRGSCSAMLWSTGDDLRNNPAIAGTGPFEVHGLQGNALALVRPQNAPPTTSYFADYDGTFGDPERAGHVGDVEIWQQCERAAGLPGDYAELGMFGFWGGLTIWPVLPPDWIPPPPPPVPPNLRLEKHAHWQTCLPSIGGGYVCLFHVRVTNTGPGDFVGPVVVEDVLPAVPPGTTVQGLGGWACVPIGPAGIRCTHAPTLLHPGDSVDLLVRVNLPPNVTVCEITNTARLVWPPGGGDPNPGDDADSDSMTVPAPACGGGSNLRIEKIGTACTAIAGWADCRYVIVVHNTGPGNYNGALSVTDTVPAGTVATFQNTPPWICGGGPPTYTCTIPVTAIPPGGVVHLTVHVRMPLNQAAHVPGCTVRNETRIVAAAGGSPLNSNPGDDTAAAELTLPPNICPLLISPIVAPPPPPPPSDPKCPPGYEPKSVPITGVPKSAGPPPTTTECVPRDPGCPPGWTKTPVAGVCCPPGQPWTGRRCGPDLPPPPPPPECRPGWTPTPIAGMCCPPGQPWTGKRCGTEPPPPPQCQPGWTPTPIAGFCCPPGKPWTGKRCGRDGPPPPPQVCPPGTVGKPPHCRPALCPPGMVGTPPNCRKVEPPRCPPGTVGTPPNCRKVEPPRCPPGTVGTPPNCRKVEPPRCPRGTVGTPPNCRKLELPRCPPGMVGKPPNCRQVTPRRCPSGMTGTPPNCRPLLQQPPTHR